MNTLMGGETRTNENQCHIVDLEHIGDEYQFESYNKWKIYGDDNQKQPLTKQSDNGMVETCGRNNPNSNPEP